MDYETFAFSAKSINCYGLQIVKNKIKINGGNVFDFDKKSDRPVLVSIYWPEQIYDFVKWRYNLNKRKKIIVGGNTPTVNPSPFIGMDCSCYLGDGELFSDDNKHLVNKNSKKKKNIALAQKISPIKFEDVQDNRRTFCEMSRGCKNKCMFCQYGWLKPYRECDITDLSIILKGAKTKSIRMFAADRFQHSRYSDLRGILNKYGKFDTGSDASLKFILKNPEYLQYTTRIRVGIEGLSYRLRKMIGKNFTDEEIVEFCVKVADNNIKCLDFYMIYGLPTEGKEDVRQFRELLKKIDRKLPKGYVIAIHWNAFTPSPQTPFQWAASSYNYDTDYLQGQIFQTKDNQRIKILHKPKLTSKNTILKRMLAIRSDGKLVKMLFNSTQYFKRPNLLVKEYREIIGTSLNDPWPQDKSFPWDNYVIYEKEKMLKLYNRRLKNYAS